MCQGSDCFFIFCWVFCDPCEPSLNVLLLNVASPALSFSQGGSFHTCWEPMLRAFIHIRITQKLRLNSDGRAGGREAPRTHITNSTEVLHDQESEYMKLAWGRKDIIRSEWRK